VNDFDCPQLAEVLDRVRMASDGGVTYTQVLKVSADAIGEDMRSEIEQSIQKAPITLTIPMVAGVFLPALVLGLIPLVVSGISQMRAN
jgi:Flp pilus assembly protein TadB